MEADTVSHLRGGHIPLAVGKESRALFGNAIVQVLGPGCAPRMKLSAVSFAEENERSAQRVAEPDERTRAVEAREAKAAEDGAKAAQLKGFVRAEARDYSIRVSCLTRVGL
jgi:hypothetical protein